MRRILVTGGTGQVGSELRRLSWPADVEILSPGRAELDLAAPKALKAFLADENVAAVINSGAYTAVDLAEDEVSKAFAVNALGPAALAEATRDRAIPLLHVSTDYVFNGEKDGAYDENDPIGPLGVYGASKEAGEQAVRSGNPRHVILRTSWVYSPFGTNFVKTMLRLGAEYERLRVIDDQRGRPAAASDIAAALSTMALALMSGEGATGTYHFANAGETTWCGFAREIFRLRAESGAPVPNVEAISTKDYPTKALRPRNSVLSTAKIERDYDIKPRSWREALAAVLREL